MYDENPVTFEESDEMPESPEPFEDDLKELGDREAFEDSVADRESEATNWDRWAERHAGVDDDHDGDPLINEPIERDGI